MRLQTAAGWRKLLFSTLLCTGALAKKNKPSVKSTKFDFIPQRVQYFDDSDVILFEDGVKHVVYRSDNAGEDWDKVSAAPAGKIRGVTMHPYDPKRAYIITTEKTHWKTEDRGEHWEQFSSEAVASIFQPPLSFHAGNPDKIIFNGMDCDGMFCEEVSMFTTDGFSSDSRFLRGDTINCQWAKSSPLFTTGQKDLDDDRILCVVKGRFSPWTKDFRLLISDNHFKDGQEFEPELEPGRTVQGIVDMVVKKKYLVVAASSDKTDELALYVSDDAIKFHRAVFPHDHTLAESAYTVLEGTNYSIQIDVMNSRPSNPMGVLLSSNSNGTYFTRNIEHTNRDFEGYVDFEKVTGIQGIFLVNTVKNYKEVEKSGAMKKLKTEITFDDGRTFQPLKCGDDDLHLQSVTHLSNSGRVFSSPAPGLVMGIGNTGDYLKDYEHGNLYISDDAGVTWRRGLKGPHKYEFGDSGSILVAIQDNGDPVGEIKYSLNHGKDWATVELEDKIKPAQLTTTKDSTSLKFLLEGFGGSEFAAGYIVAIDFDDMHERKCKDNDDDMEDWSARVDKDGKPTCLMGHTQTYRRRKADADCFVKNEFVDPVPTSVPCPCTNEDFECDFNFVRSDDREECRLAGPLIIPEGACNGFGPETTFKASSGWRLIPGNDCRRTDGERYKDEPVEKKCSEAAKPPSSGKITHEQHSFHGEFIKRVYLERTGVSTGEDETVIVQTSRNIYQTVNHGKTWDEIKAFDGEDIWAMIPHPYFNDVIYFVTTSKKVFYSIDRGRNIRSFEVPHPPSMEGGVPVMSFHSKYKDWIIWNGAKDCESSEGCHTVAWLTTDRGDGEWRILQRYVQKCEFIREPDTRFKDKESQERREKLIYCMVSQNEDNKSDNPRKLVSSDDFFVTSPEVHFENIVDFATMSEFVVVARYDDEHGLKAAASVDGQTFADARFPHGFVVDRQEGYTVLESSTHSVFLHVTVDARSGLEYGSIIKSNSNGTSYTLALNAVARDSKGYVDFEKMFGIEGLAMVNVVANYDSKDYEDQGKRLKSMITHNDGAEWSYLPPPEKDAEGKKFDCSGSLEKCSLNIHSYTDRKDKSHTIYSTSAIGLMFGVGNVGEYLTKYEDADTYMTADAGITWKPAKKGQYMWEFGDQGSIVVLVRERVPTKVIHYSLDEGDSWLDYEFSDHEVLIEDLTTVPSDNARNFLLWGWDDGQAVTVNLDFTGLTDVQCELDENDVLAGDYELWTPRHPTQNDDCLFGHVSQYHRKKKSSECYNGRMIPRLHDIARNCSCTRQDYECDYNFERQLDGSCKLVKGLAPNDPKAMCAADPDLEEYYEVTGYRKLSMSTCTGGAQLDQSTVHPCAGHQEEFDRKHRPSGVAVFFAVTIPMAIAAGVGYWVWRNWASKIGQIRLGEQPEAGEAVWIKYPVIVISGLVALAQALPLLAGSLWRSASSAFGRRGSRTFTTRDSFARGRGDYAIVDEDEGELLGDESDEEV